jgi:L-seryl-tRNA(Ser) seleniumtransferase
VVGRRALVGRLKKNPLNRALRIDKLTLAALEATLYAYEAGDPLETVPALRMLTEPLAAVRARARRLLRALPPPVRARLDARIVEDQAQVGGGALPTVVLPTAALAVGGAHVSARALDDALRAGEPAAIGRIADDRLLLDCRTVLAAQVPALARALTGAAGDR